MLTLINLEDYKLLYPKINKNNWKDKNNRYNLILDSDEYK